MAPTPVIPSARGPAPIERPRSPPVGNAPRFGSDVIADTLRELLPGSGHLVHMPAHIYARVGRYHDSVIANQKAIVADDSYLAICKPGPGTYPLGYVPHNHHFLWFAATMEGAGEIARVAAVHTGERTSDPQLMRTPGFEAMQNFSLTPLFAAVRFGRWDEITAMAKPGDDVPYMQAMWNYAQAMAAVSQGRLDDAKAFHAAPVPATSDPTIEKMLAWDRYSLIGGVQVAERFVAAEIARAEKKYDEAIAALNTAVTIEDTLPYDEPPAWNWPSRLALGNVLLQAGKAAEAEQVFRDELTRNPDAMISALQKISTNSVVAAPADASSESRNSSNDRRWTFIRHSSPFSGSTSSTRDSRPCAPCRSPANACSTPSR